ncbi:MAG: hypothetical protein IT378_06500 [Sandaracinaceae bacterium]|nr:hypothetical protein [Sandaracinaceae bacterium]
MRARVGPTLSPLLCTVLLGWAPAPAVACTCADRTVEQTFAAADAVFEGRVISVEASASGLRATLAVVQTWKGADHERVRVLTPAGEALCGVSFAPQTSWLVYANELPGGELETGICLRTRPIEEAAIDVAVFGAGVVPVDVGPEDEVEPRPTEPPARGGCASCSAAGRRSRGGWPGALVLAGLALGRRRNYGCAPRFQR